jgi:RNA polymerase sigma-70 factor, ECF subfamily
MMTAYACSEDARLERYRPRLFGIALRMLGSVADAEDVVQDAMVRWQTFGRGSVDDPGPWLVTVTTRLAIDGLRKARTRREAYHGPWLPEPVAEARLSPEYRTELASDLSMAFLVLLERLAPEERAAFLLREVFACEYADIARALGRSQAAARQMVHRARERVRMDRARFEAPPGAKERLLERFLAAVDHGDEEELLQIFGKDATWTSDGGGKVHAAGKVLRGAERIARMVSKIAAKFRGEFTYRVVQLNGEAAVVEYRDGRLFGAVFCDTDGARITAMYHVLNPEKLSHVA